jgi:hypothetical protein
MAPQFSVDKFDTFRKSIAGLKRKIYLVRNLIKLQKHHSHTSQYIVKRVWELIQV